MDEEKRQHIAQLHATTERRLWALQQRAALLGINAPPEVTIEIEELERKLSDWKRQLDNSPRSTRPLNLPTSPATEDAQIVLRAAKTWGTTLQGWLSKLNLLHPQDRLFVLQELIKSPQEKQGTTYLFAALSSNLPQEELMAIVDDMVRRTTLSDNMEYKANFMSGIPVDVLRLATEQFKIAFFRDAIDIMNRNDFKDVNLITPAVIRLQEAVSEPLTEEYVKALLAQSDSGANKGEPAARKALLSLPDEWAKLGLQMIDKTQLVWGMHKFYKEFIVQYPALWPEEKRDLFQDAMNLNRRELQKKYQDNDDW
jgi:hypothetical protein